MFDDEITIDQLESEWAEYAAAVQRPKSRWSEMMDCELILARDKFGLTYVEIANRWKEKYGWGNEKSMSDRYRAIKARDEGGSDV
jgi:hypothetical protein